MKRLLIVFGVILVLFSLVACANSSETGENGNFKLDNLPKFENATILQSTKEITIRVTSYEIVDNYIYITGFISNGHVFEYFTDMSNVILFNESLGAKVPALTTP